MAYDAQSLGEQPLLLFTKLEASLKFETGLKGLEISTYFLSGSLSAFAPLQQIHQENLSAHQLFQILINLIFLKLLHSHNKWKIANSS